MEIIWIIVKLENTLYTLSEFILINLDFNKLALRSSSTLLTQESYWLKPHRIGTPISDVLMEDKRK